MESSNRTSANKLNSKKSTGPKTVAGKSNSAKNSVKFGIYSRRLIFRSAEEKAEFRKLLRSLKWKFRPRGTLEKTHVDKMACCLFQQALVDKAISQLLLQSPLQEPKIRRFLKESNLPELALPGLHAVNGVTNWIPGSLALRLSTYQKKDDASRERTAEDNTTERCQESQKSELDMRFQPSIDALLRYKDTLRRDFNDASKRLSEIQKTRCD